MAVLKCKMCGGDLLIDQESAKIATCRYCGTKQTIPSNDNDKKITLFERANRLRLANEFDKASQIYENIITEFPDEAEAWWGLVLCRYGIEYVDDPKTGEKIPTCHRSSFRSVMEDLDYRHAIEIADRDSAELYRAEAAYIEEIRQGILTVSNQEEPYDVFICYKETDDNGDRTIDSVIAQDVYDALTDKGYRVFFARISLEDKIGREYEPYIFAALNSAPVMLVFGTEYDHFNAVWVKNEWSRYLSMISAGERKTLIPCYKNIDAYDMPEEFRKFQSQDMGKVGAIQDLLRGIGKIIPKRKKTDPVVIQQNAGNISALLKRGHQSLEDHDIDRAIAYFDQVLDQEPENGEAWFGLACSDLSVTDSETLKTKFLKDFEDADEEISYIEIEDPAETERRIEALSIDEYLTKEQLTKLFEVDNGFPSRVASLRRQAEKLENYFHNDKYMSKAIRYASGNRRVELEGLMEELAEKTQEIIRRTEEDEEIFLREKRAACETAFQDAIKEAERLHQSASQKKDADDKKAVQRKKKIIIIVSAILASVASVLLTLYVFIPQYRYAKARSLTKKNEFDSAIEIYNKMGDTNAADSCLELKIQYYEERGDFEKLISELEDNQYGNNRDIIDRVRCDYGNYLIDKGDYKEAISQFIDNSSEQSKVGFTKSVASYIYGTEKDNIPLKSLIMTLERRNKDDFNNGLLSECRYLAAKDAFSAGQYAEAADFVEPQKDYKDSLSIYQEAKYTLGSEFLNSSEYKKAAEAFESIKDYKDAEELGNKSKYQYATYLFDNADYLGALKNYEKIIDYDDAKEKCLLSKYQYVKEFYNKGLRVYGAYQYPRTVYEFLDDLTKERFKDSVSLSGQMRAWQMSIIATSSEGTGKREEEDRNTFSNKENVYFHMYLMGGDFGESVKLDAQCIYPNGKTETDSFDGEWRAGYSGWWKFYNLSKGTLRFSVLQNGKTIATKTVTIQ